MAGEIFHEQPPPLPIAEKGSCKIQENLQVWVVATTAMVMNLYSTVKCEITL